MSQKTVACANSVYLKRVRTLEIVVSKSVSGKRCKWIEIRTVVISVLSIRTCTITVATTQPVKTPLHVSFRCLFFGGSFHIA